MYIYIIIVIYIVTYKICIVQYLYFTCIYEYASAFPTANAVRSALVYSSQPLGALKNGEHDRRKELDFAYLFVVDVTQQKSFLLVAGGRELALAKAVPWA